MAAVVACVALGELNASRCEVTVRAASVELGQHIILGPHGLLDHRCMMRQRPVCCKSACGGRSGPNYLPVQNDLRCCASGPRRCDPR